MTSVFDGLAGVLNGVFGAPVVFTPQGGSSQTLKSMFRETPITVSGPDGGDVLIVAPTWRVPRDILTDVRRGDTITVPDGRVFKVLNQLPSGSPAQDAFVLYELEHLP